MIVVLVLIFFCFELRSRGWFIIGFKIIVRYNFWLVLYFVLVNKIIGYLFLIGKLKIVWVVVIVLIVFLINLIFFKVFFFLVWIWDFSIIG